MINLRTYNLEALNKHKHYKLLQTIEQDNKTQKYISHRLINFIKEPQDTKKFEIGKTYVLCKDNKYIGLIGTKEDFNRDKVIELWCTINPEYRNQGHSDKFLGEITLYLIDNIDHLEDIRLKINKDNYYSIKTAISNGYNYLYQENDTNIYQYFKDNNISKKR